MSIVAIGLNILLACLLGAALWMGARLNGRLKVLRESHEGFAKAVGDLNAAALRAERGLADLRAASDETAELLSQRIETARNLSAKLERQIQSQPAVTQADVDDRSAAERRFGALLAAVQQPRGRAEAPEPRRPESRLSEPRMAAPREAELRMAPRQADLRQPEPRRPAPRLVEPRAAEPLPDLELDVPAPRQTRDAPRTAREERLDRFVARDLPPSRPRPMADDDLFDEPQPLARLGARR